MRRTGCNFAAGSITNLAGLTLAEAAARGDLNGDFRNDHQDFVLFKNALRSDQRRRVIRTNAAVSRSLARLLWQRSSRLWQRGIRATRRLGASSHSCQSRLPWHEAALSRRQACAAGPLAAHAAQLPAASFAKQIVDRVGGSGQVQTFGPDVRNAIAIGIGVAAVAARRPGMLPSCRASPSPAARRSASTPDRRRASAPISSSSATRPKRATTIGAMLPRFGIEVPATKSASSGAACRWTASADKPSLTMIARSKSERWPPNSLQCVSRRFVQPPSQVGPLQIVRPDPPRRCRQ